MTRIIAAVFVVLASVTPTLAGSIRPEMTIYFKDGTIACLSRGNLTKFLIHGVKSEATKMQAMMIEQGGDCLMLSPSKRVKVISAEYNDPDTDIGVLEIVGQGVTRLNGAWALSIGAEEVKTSSKPKKK